MKDYTKVSIPRKFRSAASFFPNFHKPIGIVTDTDLKEARQEKEVQWLVLPNDTAAADFVNNRSSKIMFFTSTFSNLVAEMKDEGYNVSVDVSAAVDPAAVEGRNVVKRVGFDSDFYRKYSPMNAIWNDGNSKHPDLNQLMKSVYHSNSIPKLTGNSSFSHDVTTKNLMKSSYENK